MSYNMWLTAKVARQLAEEKKQVDAEMPAILAVIERAAEAGKFEITLFSNRGVRVLRRHARPLEDRDFVVTQKEEREDSWSSPILQTTIAW